MCKPRRNTALSWSASRASTIIVSTKLPCCARKTNGQPCPRLQLRTVKELIEGKGTERPSTVAALDETFKKARGTKKKHGQQREFGL